jgi:serine/threonine-protein kinase
MGPVVMKNGILWCPHCRQPHRLGERFCVATGKPLDQHLHRQDGAVRRTDPIIGTILDGRYEILRRIGAGGMGEVFEARNRLLKRSVAIKSVTRAGREAYSRLRREAEVIASIHHPNICDVYDVGTMPSGSPYVVLELLMGETLRTLLQRERRIPPGRAVEIFVQILSGLECAHTKNILHRDLTPANVFLVQRLGLPPLVKILDFGLAKDMSGQIDGMTRPGRRCGTLAYMSPEQAQARRLDRRSDIFSVGIMLFEAIAGAHPFASANVLDLGLKIIHEPCPDLCDLQRRVPRGLADVVHRALAKDPAVRYQTAMDMQRALANVTDSEEPADSCDPVSLPLPRILHATTSASASVTSTATYDGPPPSELDPIG